MQLLDATVDCVLQWRSSFGGLLHLVTGSMGAADINTGRERSGALLPHSVRWRQIVPHLGAGFIFEVATISPRRVFATLTPVERLHVLDAVDCPIRTSAIAPSNKVVPAGRRTRANPVVSKAAFRRRRPGSLLDCGAANEACSCLI